MVTRHKELISLPDEPLTDGVVSVCFKGEGIETFHGACDHVWRLPYGRTSEATGFLSVIEEQTGTCSSKHALLKMLADENGVELELIIAIYEMNEANTPGVGIVLDQSGYDSIPEAHCFLRFSGRDFDFTRFEGGEAEPIKRFLREMSVEADELVAVKKPFHFEYIVSRFGIKKAKEVWAIREDCIKALSA